VVGVAVWALRRRDANMTAVVESCAYYLNPFEWWAYSRDGYWPPSGKLVGLGWRRLGGGLGPRYRFGRRL